jgi:hypothetical protein
MAASHPRARQPKQLDAEDLPLPVLTPAQPMPGETGRGAHPGWRQGGESFQWRCMQRPRHPGTGRVPAVSRRPIPL